MEGTSSIPFKNLHSREYQGHKKKVLSVSLFLSLYSLFHFFFWFHTFFIVCGSNPREIHDFYCCCKWKVHSVAWNCTGTKLASGSVDQTARLWHIEPHGHVCFLWILFIITKSVELVKWSFFFFFFNFMVKT